MRQKRILAIHDISCFGRCSLTVALPIISAAGMECTVIPTAVLSTHTGGFTGYTYRDLTDDIMPIIDHWKTLDLKFDAIYTGFLGSFEQIDIVCETFDRIDGIRIVDPVMADSGKLYPVFDSSFPAGMRKVCEKADVIMPNITEATLMLGEEYVEGPYTPEYIEGLMERLSKIGNCSVVLTGVYFDNIKLGAATYDPKTGEKSFYFSDRIPGYYHGTGDVFGSAFTAAYMSGRTLADSMRIAVDYTVGSIKRTYSAKTDVRFGVNFEQGIPQLIRDISAVDETADTVSSLASEIWYECYKDVLTKEQIDYMLNTYHSNAMIRKEMDEGYKFVIIRDEDTPIGYTSFVNEGDRLYISKVYLLKSYRGNGYGRKIMDIADSYAKDNNLHTEYLRVNKGNPTVDFYKKMGFTIADECKSDIGNGYFMDDYVMERKI